MNINSTDVKNIYHDQYFLTQVEGFGEFSDFGGNYDQLFSRYKLNIRHLDLKPTDDFLDIGCGRGEIVMYHKKNGGSVSVGIDFSESAILIAQNKNNQLGLKCDFICCSFNDIPETRQYDKILASEFIEHISKEEGELFIKKTLRLLKPGGRLLVHTHPNTIQRRYGYRLIRYFNFLLFKRLPLQQADTLDEHYKMYHLNEQNYFSLKNMAKRAGYTKYRVFYDSPELPKNSFKFYRRKIISHTFLRHLLLNDLILTAVK